MALVNLQKILEPAYQQRYAVGAFNVINLNFVEAIVDAARDRRSPVILNIAEVHFPFVTLENIVPAIEAIAAREDVDIALNLDHGLTMEAIERSIQNGFTSIMFDGSTLPFKENLTQTKGVVELCHSKGISVEAELGAIGGAEGDETAGTADRTKYTDVEQARRFVRETGVDALAVAIGNVHGKYKGEPDLDFDLLATLREVTDIPLVLHGGSGLSEADFKRAISLGIAKVNFFTGMAQAALEATEDFLEVRAGRYHDYPHLLRRVKQRVSAEVAEQMDVFGSTGKAD